MKEVSKLEESIRIGGRDLTIWFDKEENLWKAVVLEDIKGEWKEILSVQSTHEEHVRNLFEDSLKLARAIVNRKARDEREVVEHSQR
jgi:hypothetical protein